MRITSDALDGALAPQISRAQEAAQTHGDERQGSAIVAGSGGDSVQISPLSARIQDAASADETRIAGRVAALSALYARGEYNPDSATLSRALVSHALSGANGGV
jgi:hypothetical protein